MLSDNDADRIEFELRRADRDTLVRWLKELLDDRRARSALLQGQARRLAHLRQRLKQATDYLDGLALKAQEEVQAPWPGKLLCPHCGAPVAQVRAELRQQGHVVVHDHPDGTRCENEPQTADAARPARRSR